MGANYSTGGQAAWLSPSSGQNGTDLRQKLLPHSGMPNKSAV